MVVACQVRQDHRAHLVNQADLANQVHQVVQGTQADLHSNLVNNPARLHADRVLPGHLVHQDLPAQWETREHQEDPEATDKVVHPAHQDRRAHQEHRDQLDQLDQLEIQGQMLLVVQLAQDLQDHPVSNFLFFIFFFIEYLNQIEFK